MFDRESKLLIPGAGDNILNYDPQPLALGRHSKLIVFNWSTQAEIQLT